ncbi:hypothetical protein N507_1302 [Lacticaseibacillus rhamnosus DSM 14870]|nr:hypothetical protein N507_1302 [Lacticaseibacillus rhamnosus DSM 14870]
MKTTTININGLTVTLFKVWLFCFHELDIFPEKLILPS